MDFDNDSNLVSNVDYLSPSADTITITGTGSLVLPSGNTLQRPTNGISGAMRFNTDTQLNELFVANNAWSAFVTITDLPIIMKSVANLNSMSGVQVSNASVGAVLQFNGNSWVAANIATSNTSQIVQTYTSTIGIKSGTAVFVGTRGTITNTVGTMIWNHAILPTSLSNKIRIHGASYISQITAGWDNMFINPIRLTFALFRNSTLIGTASTVIWPTPYWMSIDTGTMLPFCFVDSIPSLTNTTYSLRCFSDTMGAWYVASDATGIISVSNLGNNGIIIEETVS